MTPKSKYFKPLNFTFLKNAHSSNRPIDLNTFQLRSWITFEKERIGHIIGGEVYFYISVNPKEIDKGNEGCLRYKPVLWKKFGTHIEAKEAVAKNSREIWHTLDIFHPLKTNQERNEVNLY